jgi:predicted permease
MGATFSHDVRFGLRLLGKDRNFTVTALLTLAICIAANTAIFSLVRSVLLRPLPVPASDRVVLLQNSYPHAGAPRASTGVPDYFDRLREMTVFEEQALYRRQGVTLTGGREATRLFAVRGTPSFYRIAGARPIHGRIFTETEGEAGQDLKVLLGEGLWRREYGARADIVGTSVRLNGQPYEVVGVVPATFRFLWNDIDLWLPAAFTPEEKADDRRHSNNWQMIARLRAGATIDQAQQELDALNARNDERFPQFRQILADAGFRSLVLSLQQDLVREVRPVLYLLWGGVLFVLLIGCVNIANLVLVRSTGRAREMATRQAIGADRARLARQLLTETTTLALAGGIAGLALGSWTLRSLTAMELDSLPRGFEVSLDPVSIAVVLGIAVGAGLLLGLMPVLRYRRMNVSAVLREEGRGGTIGRGTSVMRRVLATAQVAIAFVLLVGAGLLFASFRAVAGADPGFVPSGVITAVVSLPVVTYPDNLALLAFAERWLPAVRALPGVEHAGITDVLPMTGDWNDSVILAEGYVMKPGESLISPAATVASDGYFEAMGIPLVRGRYFDARDAAAGTRVAIVDERLAAKFWSGQDPIGRRLYQPDNPDDLLKVGPKTQFITVVGVVKNVQMVPAGTAGFTPVGAYYFPLTQVPRRGVVLVARTRSDADAAALVQSIRGALSAIDPELPLYDASLMRDRVDSRLVPRRLPMLLAVAFASVALFLSAVGIYGVLAYGVAERRREIGIRMALGSTARDVFGLVLTDGMKIVGVGLALGLAGSFGLGRVMGQLLFGVEPMDATVLAVVAAVLTAIALLAVLVPARRAARVNPAVALE